MIEAEFSKLENEIASKKKATYLRTNRVKQLLDWRVKSNEKNQKSTDGILFQIVQVDGHFRCTLAAVADQAASIIHFCSRRRRERERNENWERQAFWEWWGWWGSRLFLHIQAHSIRSLPKRIPTFHRSINAFWWNNLFKFKRRRYELKSLHDQLKRRERLGKGFCSLVPTGWCIKGGARSTECWDMLESRWTFFSVPRNYMNSIRMLLEPHSSFEMLSSATGTGLFFDERLVQLAMPSTLITDDIHWIKNCADSCRDRNLIIWGNTMNHRRW